MSSESIGKKVISLLEQYAPLDWAKTISRNPNIQSESGLISDDQSRHPPYVSFRLKNNDKNIIEIIRRSIETFEGNLDWILVSHDRTPLPGINWTICPKITMDVATESEKSDLSRRDYVKQRMPEVGPMAYDDLSNLYHHLRDQLEASGLNRIDLNDS